MSHSIENYQSFDDSYSGSDSEVADEVISGSASPNLTIEESDVSDDFSSPIQIQTKNRKKRYVIESEDDEDEIENRAFSPRSRMSITGIRPADLTDDSSSEIEYSDTEHDERTLSGQESQAVLSRITEASNGNNNEADEDESSVFYSHSEGSDAQNTEIHSSSRVSDQCETSSSNLVQENIQSPPKLFGKDTSNSRVLDQCETSSNAVQESIQSLPKLFGKDTINSVHESIQSPVKLIGKDTSIVNSPALTARYSTHFEKAIKEKLSSTIYRAPVTDSSTDSEIQIVDRKDNVIEISSSESDDDEVNNELSRAKQTGTILKTKSENLLQPKISAALGNVPNLKKFSTPKSKPKVELKQVSQEYYDKEVNKLEDLKGELVNAEKLLEKISKSLPDGGKQLALRVERLRADCAIKAKYIDSICVETIPGTSPVILVDDDNSPSQNLQQLQQQRKAVFNNKAPDWDELSAAVNQIQPKHTGRQGLATFNNQKVLTVDRLKDLHGSLETCPAEHVLADDPKGLKVTLMDHQKHALAWMNWREKQKPRGGILADDMGLGKTLTMISLVLECKNRDDEEEDSVKDSSESEDESNKNSAGWSSKGRRDYYPGGTLVVCPASLLQQWEGEAQSKVSRHRLTVCVHHGNNRETKPKHLRTYDMVITTYNIVSREQKSRGALFGIKWQRIILDEAHVVRNHKSQISMAACELRGRARWALTGTPIQNKEMDVYALLKFLHCTPFDDLGHWKKWIDKSAGGQQRLNTIMKSLMLRRTKVQLQERGELQCLPQKSTEIIEVNLDTDEMNVYQKIMIFSRTLFAQFLFQRAERNSDLMYTCESSRPAYLQTRDPNGAYYKMHQKFTKIHKGSKEIKSHEILVLLLRLRQICCHPGLIDAMLEDEDAQHIGSDSDVSQPEIDLLAQLNKLAISDNNNSNSLVSGRLNNSDGEHPMRPEEQIMAKASSRVLQRTNPVFDYKRPSTKMLKILDTLRNRVLSSGDKAIVVSQWTSVLNILKTHIEEQGFSTLSLDGSVPVKNRQDIVSEFNSSKSQKCILLLSLTAGGVGLNLVGANHLLLIDLHWNPQLEAQAQDRIYRVGQKKDVIIYKFMCKDTVEERIKALQDHKLALADGVLAGARISEGSKLTIEDLKGLFGM